MTTIFTIMSALATEHNAINLSQGFPDFPIDSGLTDMVTQAMQAGQNQYAPMAGLPALRHAISQDFHTRYDLVIDPDTEITITPGATYAIYTAFATILKPGDEAIVLEPAYDSYIPNIRMCGATPVPVPLTSPDFTPDWPAIKAAINKRTKAIIINTPHNPTGATWTTDDWTALAEIVDGTDIYILSDEVYEQLTYDGITHQTILQQEALRPRSFAIYSFGKVFHNTGWKIGYCIAPPSLTASFRLIHQYLAFSVNTPMQAGIASYLSLPNRAPVRQMLQSKRDYFLNLMRDTPFTLHQPAGGSYFQILSYQNISTKPDREFAEWLTKEYKVATIPVSAFYTTPPYNHLLRFCFAKKEETLDAAAERLKNIV
jgi:methionine aminotransferase